MKRNSLHIMNAFLMGAINEFFFNRWALLYSFDIEWKAIVGDMMNITNHF